MNKITSISTVMLLCTLGSGVPILAEADDNGPIDVEGVVVSIDQAISIAVQEIPGTVLGVEIESEDNTLIWEIKIKNNENLTFEVEVDATTGAVLEIEEDD